jgi:hypothetical protein
MFGRAIFFLGVFLSCAGSQAQVPASAASADSSTHTKALKTPPTAAELAIDAARRWTQATFTAGSSLQPLQRDILLVRLADIWKDVDHPKAEEYLKDALDHLRSDAAPDASPENKANYSAAIESVSSEVRGLDRKAWDALMEDLPKWAVSDTIARQANELAMNGDVAGAMELEAKSLQHGGSFIDVSTLNFISDTDPGTAAKLFDQIMTTAATPEGDPNLLFSLLQDAFPNKIVLDAAPDGFYSPERKQRVLNLLAKLILQGKEAGACNYGFAENLMPNFPPQLQGQLGSVIQDCAVGGAGGATHTYGTVNGRGDTTDNLVEAMEGASDARSKASLRERAVRSASEIDHDYLRAVQLCLDVSQAEREQSVGSAERFERWAAQSAFSGVQAAFQKHDQAAAQRLLDILPPRIKPDVELYAVRRLAKPDKPRALLMLADASSVLEREVSLKPETYVSLLEETAKLSPSDVTSAWRALVRGLNRFDQANRLHAQSGRRFTLLDEWPVPLGAIVDESFVRASIDDLDSAEFREQFRMGVVEAFLSRYTELLKESKTTSVVAGARN